MKLKNFIELYVDENIYTKHEETGQLEIVQKIPSKKAFFNIDKISCFGDKRIFFKKLNRPVEVIETSEEIQQKILECQNLDSITMECISSEISISKPEHKEIIKPYNNPDTERNVNEF